MNKTALRRSGPEPRSRLAIVHQIERCLNECVAISVLHGDAVLVIADVLSRGIAEATTGTPLASASTVGLLQVSVIRQQPEHLGQVFTPGFPDVDVHDRTATGGSRNTPDRGSAGRAPSPDRPTYADARHRAREAGE